MKFDKKIKDLSRDIDIPKSYDKRVDELLLQLDDKEAAPKRRHTWKFAFGLVVCLLFLGGFLFFGKFDMEANIITYLKETIIDFLKGDSDIDTDKSGVESKKMYVEGKQDLMLELHEAVIDAHGIYLLVRVTAPTNIKFSGEIGFDYFCFCQGSNYSNNQLLGGARDCQLVKVDSEKPNVALYMVSQAVKGTLEEGSDVTVSFKDMMLNPYSENPQMLVEGMWSLTFPYYPTVKEDVMIEGTSDMVFPYINTTATVKSIELTPLRIVLFSDVSNFPDDERGVSDTTIAITLEMLDGKKKVIVSHDPDEEGYIQGGSISFSEVDGKTHQQDNLEFTDMIDINKVVGIYIEDLYIPVE